MTFEEWAKNRQTMDGYPAYTADEAWAASCIETLSDVLAALYEAKEYQAYEVIYKVWREANLDAWVK